MIANKTSPKKKALDLGLAVRDSKRSPDKLRSFIQQKDVSPSQQTIYAQMNSTDFGSKGLFKPTTTLAGKTSLRGWIEHIQAQPDSEWKNQNETVKFKDAANLKLAGTTFDSNHLSRFLNESNFATRDSPKQNL